MQTVISIDAPCYIAEETLIPTQHCVPESKACENFSCKFLVDKKAIEKMYLARDILLENIDTLMSIKDLSRKVAINECYLKKGFKEIFGITIYNFYLSKKMEHAKYLLCEKGMSVTEVAAKMGYSSISHFSTAFKKHTGLKPCELLR